MIWESLLVIMPYGVPNLVLTCLKNSSAKSAAVVSSLVGMNRAYLVTRSIMVKIALYFWPPFFASGSPMIQFREISLNGAVMGSIGIGRGSN